MNKLSFYGIVTTALLSLVLLSSCDRDFNEMGSGIVGDDHFDFKPDTTATIRAYNLPTGVLQSNNLSLNSLGIYNNPVFGKVKANFVTELELASLNPVFKVENNPVLDSVVLTIPYFSTKKSDSDNKTTYTLDSIKGTDPINLKVYESGFVLNDLNPNDNFQTQQRYYTNQDSDFNNNKIGAFLNNSTDVKQNTSFETNKNEVVILKLDRGLKPVLPKEVDIRLTPRIQLKLDKTFFQQKIMNAPAGKLVNNNVFREYFKGIYFKVDDATNGTLMQLDFSKGDITLHYHEYASVVDGVPVKYDNSVQDAYVGTPKLVSKTLALNMKGNTVNLLDTQNSNLYATALSSANKVNGDSRLLLKGGEGSMAVIDLFGPDNFGADGVTGTPDGVADELNIIRNKGWLINEANLIFYIDKNQMTAAAEPLRIYLYDLNNKRPLIDWGTDISVISSKPKLNKYIHDGIIQRENGRGIKYRIRITNHIRNLVRKDSTNVRLGVSVTEAIGLISNVKLKSPQVIDGAFSQSPQFTIDRTPASSLLNPLGTILYGNNIAPQSPDYKKRLKLEIYYTKPN